METGLSIVLIITNIVTLIALSLNSDWLKTEKFISEMKSKHIKDLQEVIKRNHEERNK